jgi:hypothetical protein
MLRSTDTLLRTLGGDGFLPEVPPVALIMITGFVVIEASIILTFAHRVWVRRQYRTLWRFPVALSARFSGSPARCMDLHQRGAAVAIDATELPAALRDATQPVPDALHLPLTIDVQLADGTMRTVRGRLQPRSVRPIGEGAVRIGGRVTWDDAASRTAVIERCYVVEPYGARRAHLKRRATRHAVRLEAQVGGFRARTSDVSEFGAALVLRRRSLPLSVPVPITVRLPDGRTVHGRFHPLNRSAARDGLRIGGEVEWRDTDWIASLPIPA